MQLLLSLLLLTAFPGQLRAGQANLAWETCNSERIFHTVDTQAVITGLFQVRSQRARPEKEDDLDLSGETSPKAEDKKICGPATKYGVQTVEAVRWALANLNRDYGAVFGQEISTSFVPGIRLGIDIYDTCGHSSLAIHHALDSLDDLHSSSCAFNRTRINLGVIGPRKHESIREVADFLESYHYPTVSHGMADKKTNSLSNLLKTSPDIALVAKSMVALAKEFSWEAVSLIYDDSWYGTEGKGEILRIAKAMGLCISHMQRIRQPIAGNVTASQEIYRAVAKRLRQNLPNAPGVLVFASEEVSLKLLETASTFDQAQGFITNQQSLRWVFSNNIPLQGAELKLLPVHTVRGVFAVGPNAPLRIPEFDNYWISTDARWQNVSVWMREIYQREAKCRFADDQSADLASFALCNPTGPIAALYRPILSEELVQALDAVYTFAYALKEAWKLKCRGPGLCPQLVQIPNEEFLSLLRNAEFEYGSDIRTPPSLRGRKVNMKTGVQSVGIFELLQDSSAVKFSQIYSFHTTEGLLPLTKPVFYSINVAGTTVQSALAPSSTCLNDCLCHETTSATGYHYRDGDITLAGYFPIHSSTERGYECGSIRKGADGYQLALAFNYAVDKLNRKVGPFARILSGVKLGSLTADTCESPARTSYLLGGILTGDADVSSDGDLPIQSDTLLGVIGAMSDETTRDIAALLKSSEKLQISYAAESLEFDDRTENPSLLRTVLSDSMRIQLVFEVLKTFKWDFVQILYSQTAYGKNMAESFQLKASENKVCIAQSLEINTVLFGDLLAYENANVVLVFAEKLEIQRLLSKVRPDSSLIFIAPKYWGNDLTVAREGIESITMEVPTSQNAAFNQYLIRRSITDQSDPWFREFVEAGFDCSFSDPTKIPCNSDGIVGQMPNFEADPRANHIVNAVYSFAYGLHAVLQQYCGENYIGICNGYRSVPEKERNFALLDAVKTIRFRDESNRNFGYSNDGDGSLPLTIYSYQRKYMQVGTYPAATNRPIINALAVQYFSTKSSTCNDPLKCPQCAYYKDWMYPKPEASLIDSKRRIPVSTGATTGAYLHTPGTLYLGGLFPIHKQGENPFECGEMSDDGIMMLEAFLWAIDTINRNAQVVKNVTIGALAMDTCGSAGETYINLRNLFTNPESFKVGSADSIYGFLDPPSNAPALSAAEILNNYGVTNIGPDSPTDQLSDQAAYPFTLRTSVPTEVQTTVLLQIMDRLNFSYISVVHSSSSSSRSDGVHFVNQAEDKGLCVAMAESLPSSASEMDQLVLRLKTKKIQGARVVVLLLEPNEIREFLIALKRNTELGLLTPGEFSLFSVSSWGDDTNPISGYEGQALGAITVQYDSQPLDPMIQHIQQLNYKNNLRNPWWKSFWEQKFNCQDEETCSGHNLFTNEINLTPVLANIINAVWAMAVGLGNLQQQFCGNVGNGLCETLLQQPQLRQLILSNVMNAAFTRADNPAKTFRFISSGHADLGLKILNVVRPRPEESDQDSFYRHVGSFANNSLQMTIVPMAYENDVAVQIRSLKSECLDKNLCFECRNHKTEIEDFIPSSSAAMSTSTTTTRTTTMTTTSQPTTTTIMTTTPEKVSQSFKPFPTPPTFPPPPQIPEALPKYTQELYYDEPSSDGFLIPAVFPVHRQGNEPFSCGEIVSENYQTAAAYLWALEQLNRDPAILPGIKLGSMILDSCSQPSRAVRDLSNFLTNQVEFNSPNGSKIVSNKVIGVVTSWGSEETFAVTRVTKQFGMAAVSPGADVSLDNTGKVYSSAESIYRTSVSTWDQVQAMATLMLRMGWRSIAVLYSDDLYGSNGRRDFESAVKDTALCIAMIESLPSNDCNGDLFKIDRTLERLIALRRSGVYGVVLMVSEPTLQCLIKSVERAIRSGSLKSGDLVWFIPANIGSMELIAHGKEASLIGMIHLQYTSDLLPEFEQYWSKLESQQNVHLWTKENIDRSIECESGNCTRTSPQNLDFVTRNSHILPTVNAVYSIAHTLDILRREICGVNTFGLCPTLSQNYNLRQEISRRLADVQFADVSGMHFKFTSDLYGNQGLQLVNLQRNVNGYTFQKIGTWDSNGLTMTMAPAGFENGVQPYHLGERLSECMDFAVCPVCQTVTTTTPYPATFPPTPSAKEFLESILPVSNNTVLEEETPQRSRQPEPEQTVKQSVTRHLAPTQLTVGSHRVLKDALLIPSNKRFSLAGVFPVHKSLDMAGLTCGDFNSASGFQKFAAFLFALQEVNDDPYILPGVNLGALVLDSCSSEERAMANMFEIFADKSINKIQPSDIVTVLGLNNGEATNMGDMLNHMDIAQVSSLPVPLSLKDHGTIMGTVPADDLHVDIYSNVLEQMGWTYVSVIAEDNPIHQKTADYFERTVTAKGICVASTVSVPENADIDDLQISVRKLVMNEGATAVLVFLSDANMRLLLQALTEERVAPARFVLVTNFDERWTSDANFLGLLARFEQGLLTIEVQRYNNTNFLYFLSGLTLENHQPFPTNWFHEFWQTTFECFLPGSAVRMGDIYNFPCTGNEQLNIEEFQQSPSVLPTVLAVHTAARGLHRFIKDNCPGRDIQAVDECNGLDTRVKLMESMKSVNFSYSYSPSKDPIWVKFDRDGFMSTEFSIRNLLRMADGNYQYTEVGVWRPDSGLMMDVNQVKVLGTGNIVETPQSHCPIDPCPHCSNVTISMEHIDQPDLADNFDSVWGIIVAAFSGLGMVICVICMTYFLISFPVNFGTTICGYIVLFGLFCVYGLAFVYILNPSVIVCAVRRVATGICWAFVYAPMLVKVVHTWHMRSFEGKMGPQQLHTTSPCALFFLAAGVASVQIVIAVEWIILSNPQSLFYVTNLHKETMARGTWRCMPGEDFEQVLMVSMVYVMFLIFLTMVFSLATWNADAHNRESRWIFIASVFSVGIWVAWGLLITQTNLDIRDPTTAIALIVNATIILMCLYMRKAYLYQKYREEARDYIEQSQSMHSSLNSHGFMYGPGGKMVLSHGMQAGNPVFVHALPALPAANGNGSISVGDPSAMMFQNVAYDGGSEFNPAQSVLGGSTTRGSKRSAVKIVENGSQNGNGEANNIVEESHRF